jgi:hypothetical protein
MKNFLPETLQQWLICILIIALIVALVPFGVVGYRIKSEVTPVKLRNLLNSLQNVGDSATLNANAYGSVADSTRATLDKHVNPAIDQMVVRFNSTMIRFEKKIDLLEPLLVQVTAATEKGGNAIAHFDNRFNGENGLLAALTDTTKRGGEMISNEDRVLQGLASEGKAVLEELREIVKSDEWKQIRGEMLKSMQNASLLTGHANEIAVHTDETAIEARDIAKLIKEYVERYAPGILAALEKISKETSKYQKAALLANIFRLLAIGLGAL